MPTGEAPIGEAWETEVSTIVQKGPYAGYTPGEVTKGLGTALLGQKAHAIFGSRFPLLARFIDANVQLSVQAHPRDAYADKYEGGSWGKPNSDISLGQSQERALSTIFAHRRAE